jgi:hypothetical protein
VSGEGIGGARGRGPAFMQGFRVVRRIANDANRGLSGFGRRRATPRGAGAGDLDTGARSVFEWRMCKMTPSRCCSTSATQNDTGLLQRGRAPELGRGEEGPRVGSAADRERVLRELAARARTDLEGERGSGTIPVRRCLGNARLRSSSPDRPTGDEACSWGACDNSDGGRAAAPSWASG